MTRKCNKAFDEHHLSFLCHHNMDKRREKSLNLNFAQVDHQPQFQALFVYFPYINSLKLGVTKILI